MEFDLIKQVKKWIVQRKWMDRVQLEKMIQWYTDRKPQVPFLEFLLQNRGISQPQYQALRGMILDSSTSLTHVAPSLSRSQPSQLPILTGNVQKYQFIRELGQGGMGKVYLALDRVLQRRVALKLALQDQGEQVTRLLQEAQIGSQLEHPNIAPVYEAGLAPPNRLYFTMKYVEGISLADIVEKLAQGDEDTVEKYPFRRRIEFVIKVLEGLAYSHAQGIIHRDIKPDNIMVGRFGEVLLVDWGLAKLVDEAVSEDRPSTLDREALRQAVKNHTLDGTITGTPGYMAPEQALGEQGKDGIPSDIFAIGCVLYEVSTTVRPFEGETSLEVLYQTAEGKFSLPRQVAPQIPRPLEAIILKAMSLHPGQRYRRAEDLIDDLQAFLEEREVSVYTYRPREKVKKWLKKRFIPLQVSLLVLIVVVLFSVLVIRERVRIQSEKMYTKMAQSQLEKERLAAEKASEKARRKMDEVENTLAETNREYKEELSRLEKAKNKRVKDIQKYLEAFAPYAHARDLTMRSMKFHVLKEAVIPKLKEAIAIKPSFLQARVDLIKAYFYLNRMDYLIGEVIKLPRHMPKDKAKEFSELIMAALYNRGKDYDELILMVRKNKPENLGQIYWDVLQAFLLLKTKKYKQALGLINDILRRPEGQTWEMLYFKCEIYYDVAMSLPPSDPRRTKFLQQGLVILNQALQNYSNIPYLYLNRARIKRKLGFFGEARKDYRRLMVLDSSCEHLWEQLAHLHWEEYIKFRGRERNSSKALAKLLASLRYLRKGREVEPNYKRFLAKTEVLNATFTRALVQTFPHLKGVEPLSPKFLHHVYQRLSAHPHRDLEREFAFLIWEQPDAFFETPTGSTYLVELKKIAARRRSKWSREIDHPLWLELDRWLAGK